MKKIITIALLLIFLATCFFLGGRMLIHHDFYYLSDQARDYLLVKDIVLNHKLTLIGSHSGLGGLFHGPLWLYILVPFFILGKGNPLIFAYWYGAIPILTIFTGYFVGSKLYSKSFGLVVSFLLAVNAILWGYINNTIGINLMPLFYLVFIYFSVIYLRGNNKSLIAVAFLAGLSFQLETASAIALLPLVIFIILLAGKFRENIKNYLYAILAFILSLGTFILFDLRHQFLITKSALQLFDQNQGHKDYANLSQRILDHIIGMRDTYFAVIFSGNLFINIIYIAIVIYAVYLLLKAFKSKSSKAKELAFLFFTPSIVYILFFLYPHPIYREYVLDMIVSVIFAFSLMLTIIWKTLSGKVLTVIFIGFTIFSTVFYLKSIYQTPYTQDNSSGSYVNQKQVADWIILDSAKKNFGYFVYTPETFTYGMDYLFWYESKLNNIQNPQSTKLADTYLILYPPLNNDSHAHDFWIKNTIKTSAVPIKTKTFPSGIIVEKMDLSKDIQEVDPNYYQNLIFR